MKAGERRKETMAQVISLSSIMTPAGRLSRARRAGHPIDPEVKNIRPWGFDEAPLDVEFVGLTEAEQRRAIAGFPGGRRFRLVGSCQPERRAT